MSVVTLKAYQERLIRQARHAGGQVCAALEQRVERAAVAVLAEQPYVSTIVLVYAADLGDNEAHYVYAAFTAHELEAIATAQPTPGAHGRTSISCAQE